MYPMISGLFLVSSPVMSKSTFHRLWCERLRGLKWNSTSPNWIYDLQDQNGAWLITFPYQHSTNQVTLELACQTSDSGLVGWILVVAILIPLITAIVLIALKKSKSLNPNNHWYMRGKQTHIMT